MTTRTDYTLLYCRKCKKNIRVKLTFHEEERFCFVYCLNCSSPLGIYLEISDILIPPRKTFLENIKYKLGLA